MNNNGVQEEYHKGNSLKKIQKKTKKQAHLMLKRQPGCSTIHH